MAMPLCLVFLEESCWRIEQVGMLVMMAWFACTSHGLRLRSCLELSFRWMRCQWLQAQISGSIDLCQRIRTPLAAAIEKASLDTQTQHTTQLWMVGCGYTPVWILSTWSASWISCYPIRSVIDVAHEASAQPNCQEQQQSRVKQLDVGFSGVRLLYCTS